MVFIRDHISGIVRIQAKTNGIVNIRPVGVMLLSLCCKSHFRHKGESLGEIIEFKFGL